MNISSISQKQYGGALKRQTVEEGEVYLYTVSDFVQADIFIGGMGAGGVAWADL